jgi:hypothetical protein
VIPALLRFTEFFKDLWSVRAFICHQPCSSHAGAGLGVAMALISQRHPAS